MSKKQIVSKYWKFVCYKNYNLNKINKIQEIKKKKKVNLTFVIIFLQISVFVERKRKPYGYDVLISN